MCVYVCERVCVCMSVRERVCVCVCKRESVYVCESVCERACVCECVRVCERECVCVWVGAEGFASEGDQEEVRKVERQLKSRFPIGSHVSEQRIVQDFLKQVPAPYMVSPATPT